MKYFFLIFFSLFYSLTASAQPSIEWATNYHIMDKIQYDKNNACFYLYGGAGINDTISPNSYSPTTPNCFQDTINGNTDFYLAKFDTLGNRIWATYFGGNGSENMGQALSKVLQITSNGSIIISGITSSNQDLVTTGTPGSQNPLYPLNNPSYINDGISGFLAKFDSNGNRLWARYFGDSVVMSVQDLTLDQDDNIIILASANGLHQIPASAGSFQQFPNNSSNPVYNTYLGKFNGNDGSLEWWTYYWGAENTFVKSVVADSNNNIYFTGNTKTTGMATPNAYHTSFPAGTYPGFLTKFNAVGQQIWCTYLLDSINGIQTSTAILLTDKKETIYRLSQTNVNGLATSGSFQVNLSGESDLLLYSFDAADGHPNWSTYYGTKWLDWPLSFILNQEKDLIIVGRTDAPQKVLETECSLNNDDYLNFITKFLKNGQRQWTSYYSLGYTLDSSNVLIDFRDVATDNGKSIYTISHSFGPGLSTPGAFYENNILKRAGLITRFQDTFICPDRHFDITQNGDTLFVTGGYEQYTWFKNGIALGGSDSFLIIDFSDADYYVKIEDGCGCSYQTDIFGVTGISEKEHMAAIRLFPNPNKGKFWLKGMINMPQENLLYTVSDLRGKVLQEGSFKVKNRIIDQEIVCSELSAGMYFLELKLKEGRVVLKLVVED